MDEKEYKKQYLKRYEREPLYRKALYECTVKMLTLTTETGVIIKSRGTGLYIEYNCVNGNKIGAMVFREAQYLEELYRITEIAYQEHPEITRLDITKKTIIPNNKVTNIIQKEEG